MRTIAFIFVSFAAACTSDNNIFDIGLTDLPRFADDGGVIVTCESYCIRPSDCAIGFLDGDTCPIGFLCSTTYACTLDSGTR